MIRILSVTLFIVSLPVELFALHSYFDLQGLNPNVYSLAKHVYQCENKDHRIHNPLLTVVDFSKPSSQKRLWVIDMEHHKVIDTLRVSHGINSGSLFATHFSNKVGSHESSLGAFLTKNSYQGKFGYSMRLKGLEPGINNNAYQRDIVMHGSPYVNQKTVEKYGKIARTYGCLAVDNTQVKALINRLKGGSLIFNYAHQENNDAFLKKC